MSEDRQPMSFERFKEDWLIRHPSSVPKSRTISTAREWFWIFLWVVVAICAAIFSAAHTVPAAEMTIFRDMPHRDKLAITAFVVVEMVIFAASAGRKEIKWLRWLLMASLVVALMGMVGASVRAVIENGGDILNIIGGVFLSILTPFTALASGEVTHIQLDKRAAKQSAYDDQQQERLQVLDAVINAAYTRYLNSVNTIKDANLIKNNQISPRSKPSPRLQKAVDWLENNPGNLDTAPRELERAIGVSYGTIFNAQKHLKELSTNGNHKGE